MLCVCWQVMKLRVALHKFLAAHDWKGIRKLEAQICERLRDSERNFDIATLRRCVVEIMPHEYLRALDFAYRIGSVLRVRNFSCSLVLFMLVG